MENKGVNIYIYLEYRKYLQDYYSFKKNASKSFTYRKFSESAGFSTPNFLQLLIQGKRNLRKSSIEKVSKALHHSAEEAAYFELLVNFDQVKTVAEKTRCFTALSELRKPYQISRISELQFEHLRAWYHKAIRELLGFYAFDENERYAYRKLAALLSPPITESEARNSVKLLINLGLLKRNDSGKIIQADRFITTGDEVQDLSVRTFHQAMLDRAKEAVDRIPPEYRDISSLSVTLSDNGFAMMKQELQLFRKRLLEIVKIDSHPGNVYQVNFQMFPLTNLKKTRKINRFDDEKK
ncbi:MAG: TIGR02147 family protein [Chitinispirillaceae bacterium]|nr:TIGR02147 family protein [Chitinispirillaceae bacterium]